MSGSVIVWRDEEPAQIHWDETSDGWYVSFLSVEQPAALAPLLAKVRAQWRAAGRPKITFDISPSSQAMGRFVALLNAEHLGAGRYELRSLDNLRRTDP